MRLIRAAVVVVFALPLGIVPPVRTVEVRYLGGLAGPARVADVSGRQLHGEVLTGGGGAVTSVTEPAGDRVLRFPGGSCTSAPCPQAIIRPPRSESLAGRGRFTFGADIRLTEPAPAGAGMNVFQFGRAGAGHSQWKLQVDSGRPSCRWSDGNAAVLLDAGLSLQVGRWYRVTCARLSRSLFQIRVRDPRTGEVLRPPVRDSTALGDILPAGRVVIGGKQISPRRSDIDTDQFHGDLTAIEFSR
ncbi:hypothetical protein [Actinoplanes couchii]|uniref:hypothetical protein n=1 Tax=Actinoplanes couchii TaxID=403638 RepID=UPI0019421F13|nr:hypothetical protein [Actinoplanes couchii]MDR6320701.1 hypothetical protein [Actinoplanes couchii]